MHTCEVPDFWGVTQKYELPVSFNDLSLNATPFIKYARMREASNGIFFV